MKFIRVLKALNYDEVRKTLRDENNGIEMYFAELVKQNGDILWPVNRPIPFKYKDLPRQSVFDYSVEHSSKKGTVDSFKYYNDYVVLLKNK